jgi:hypothetical protein
MITSRIRAVGALALACVGLAGCGEKPPTPPKLSQVFPRLPLPPQPSLVSRSGGADALQITFRSPRPKKEIESYYRRVLSEDGWRLINHATGPDGAAVLLAERDGSPLWVRIHAARDDSTATLIELAGALVKRQDSTAAASKPTS